MIPLAVGKNIKQKCRDFINFDGYRQETKLNTLLKVSKIAVLLKIIEIYKKYVKTTQNCLTFKYLTPPF